MNNLKEVLNSCDCEYLPTLNEFRKIYKSKYLDYVEPEMYDKKYTKAWFEINEFGDLISQPLTLSMFVPVSEEGEVLEEPIQWYNWLDFQRVKETGELTMHPFTTTDMEECEAYKQAQYRVIFECNEKQKRLTLDIIIKQFNTIEHAVNDGLKLKLIK